MRGHHDVARELVAPLTRRARELREQRRAVDERAVDEEELDHARVAAVGGVGEQQRGRARRVLGVDVGRARGARDVAVGGDRLEQHLHRARAGLDEAERPGSVYCQFAEFLAWRKKQPAMMSANRMTLVAGGPKEIVFDRISEAQNLRCRFDFETLTASIAEI